MAAAGFGPGVRLGPAFVDILTPSPSSLQLLITYYLDRSLLRPFIIYQTTYSLEEMPIAHMLQLHTTQNHRDLAGERER